MGGDAEEQTTIIRYAPYVETYHKTLLAAALAYRIYSVKDDPYKDWEDRDFDCAFFGSGYTLCSYPSLYDMFGKFMAGLDLEVIFGEIFEDTVNGTVVNNTIAREAIRTEDELEDNIYPRFETGMRDINSVISSSFIVGRAMLESARVKALENFAAQARYSLMPIVVDRYKAHLQWNEGVIARYQEILKFYVMYAIDIDNHNLDNRAKESLWPFNALQYEAQAIGTLQAARDIKSDVAGGSTASKVLGGAATGASVGAYFGGVGAGIGAGIGALLGWASTW